MKHVRTPEGLLLEKRDLFTTAEIARLFGVSSQAVHLWIRNGKIRSFDRSSERGHYLISRREVAHLLELEGREVPGLWERTRVKVLLIDDDRGIREFALLAAESQAFPMNLKAASTVEDGLLLAGQFRPDVILLDTFFSKDLLGGEEGVAFIRHSKLIRKVKTIAMVDNRRIGTRMIKAGSDATLLKPFSLGEFRNAIYAQWKGGKHTFPPTELISASESDMNQREPSTTEGGSE